MNMGFVEGERPGGWFFYTDGYTQGVGEIGEQLDKERLSIVRAYGLPEISVVEALLRYYGHQGMNGREFARIIQGFADPPSSPRSQDDG